MCDTSVCEREMSQRWLSTGETRFIRSMQRDRDPGLSRRIRHAFEFEPLMRASSCFDDLAPETGGDPTDSPTGPCSRPAIAGYGHDRQFRTSVHWYIRLVRAACCERRRRIVGRHFWREIAAHHPATRRWRRGRARATLASVAEPRGARPSICIVLAFQSNGTTMAMWHLCVGPEVRPHHDCTSC